jgi:hypothetical protein
MQISVIICTHNPRLASLERTLQSLYNQSLDIASWELLLVDNCSKEPVASRFDVSWHPSGRIILEENIGLTLARLRGIKESSGDLICFVDDDNVLDVSYLQAALIIARDMPFLGCWGGEITGEYEIPPAPWFSKYESMLAVRPLQRDSWGNAYRYDDALPCGAGMCARRSVVTKFLSNCQNSQLRRSLGRSGTSLGSGEDVDLAYTAIDMGMGTGRFTTMRMLHLIPASRLDPDYLEKLAEGMAESNVYVDFIREQTRPKQHIPNVPKKSLRYWLKWFRASSTERRIMEANHRGLVKGIKYMETVP